MSTFLLGTATAPLLEDTQTQRTMKLIRRATAHDFSTILAIYQAGTTDDRSYDYPRQEVDFQARKQWFDAHQGRFPIFAY